MQKSASKNSHDKLCFEDEDVPAMLQYYVSFYYVSELYDRSNVMRRALTVYRSHSACILHLAVSSFRKHAIPLFERKMLLALEAVR